MTIKRFLSLSIILLALISCSLGALVAADSWTTMSDLAIAKARLSLLRVMADIPATILPQRSLLSLMVTSAAPGDGAQQATLAKIKQTSAAAFAQALAGIGALPGGAEEARTLDADLAKATAQWVALEQSVSDAIAKPIGDRGDLATSVLRDSVSINASILALMRGECAASPARAAMLSALPTSQIRSGKCATPPARPPDC
jgi:hypothetical protein